MTFNKEDRIGLFSVAKIFVEDFEWIFREQPINDFGIDAFVEITKNAISSNSHIDIFPTGRLIGIQIKSGQSYFKEEKNGKFVFRGSLRHLKYWLSHTIPIIIVLYNKTTHKAYWQEIKESTVTLTRKTFKVNIPKNNLLNITAGEKLKKIGYFRNIYEYKLWQLTSVSELIKVVLKQKHFLYIELSDCHWTDDFLVSILITQEDDDNIPYILNCGFQYHFSFYLQDKKSIVSGIKDTIPWINLIYGDLPFTDEIFYKNVITYYKEYEEYFRIDDQMSIYSIACHMTGDYYFKLDVSPNELAYNFLALNEFLTKEPEVEQRFFL